MDEIRWKELAVSPDEEELARKIIEGGVGKTLPPFRRGNRGHRLCSGAEDAANNWVMGGILFCAFK